MSKFDKYLSGPKKTLMVDACGAGLTALLLATILEPFQKEFGMPLFVLRIFSIIACIYCIYSLMSFYFGNERHAFLLKVIAFGNTFYGLLIAFFVYRYFGQLTTLGRCYFVLETAIIFGLVFWEMKVAFRSSKN